jgi:hypothetical protein
MSESVLYCEGYHDRAFWKGWLGHLGCVDPGSPPPGRTGRVPIFDPWGTEVKGSQYAYHSRSGGFIRVVPCAGKAKILPLVRIRLGQRSSKASLRLVINIDSDVNASGARVGASGLQRHDVEHLVHTSFDPGAAVSADGEIELDGGATKVSLVLWKVSDPPVPGLPDQQTLERLASAVLAAAYPARAASVQNWLDARPSPPGEGPKEHAWSYMAGWYAEHGCQDFYSNLWNNPQVVAELEARLRSSGAWQIAERLTS